MLSMKPAKPPSSSGPPRDRFRRSRRQAFGLIAAQVLAAIVIVTAMTRPASQAGVRAGDSDASRIRRDLDLAARFVVEEIDPADFVVASGELLHQVRRHLTRLGRSVACEIDDDPTRQSGFGVLIRRCNRPLSAELAGFGRDVRPLDVLFARETIQVVRVQRIAETHTTPGVSIHSIASR
jgi:hypothetical protein